ncbi:TPA: hypothetical protein QDZ84_000333 [Shewanella algae]|uniref:hypothetical protein n=1 Tax=Gammaproteobacteria TaxID=1236 RepID=UPI001C58F9C7|nr:hypothetical protein [Shewanella algae]HDS1205391.1 hypothetical protein [Shewanella algae]
MDTFVKFGIFFLGALFSILLVPRIEQKKADFQRKERYQELMVELDDLQKVLCEHLSTHFQFLYNIRTESELAQSGNVPVPIPSVIDVEILVDLYKQSALILNSSQRLAIKRIPNSVREIVRQSQSSVDSIVNEKTYCIQSVKNTIKLSCRLVYEINAIRHEQERFVTLDNLDSNSATIKILKSEGFTDEQIEVSKIKETGFDNIGIKI